MKSGLMARLRYGAVVVFAVMWLNVGEARTPLTPACDGFCGPAAECFWQCQVPVGEIWQFITCGEYEGGPSGDMCDPDSCETACTVGTSCGWECSSGGDQTDCETFGTCASCGDGYCAFGIETRTSCAADCGYCGDGICQAWAEAAGSGYCPGDCGPNNDQQNECNPVSDPYCESNKFCNANTACVPPDEPCSGVGQSHGHCHDNSDCCQGTYCFIDCDAYPWMCINELVSPPELHPNGVCLPPGASPAGLRR